MKASALLAALPERKSENESVTFAAACSHCDKPRFLVTSELAPFLCVEMCVLGFPSGNSPHPSVPEEEDSQSELLIAEDKMSPEQEGQLMPRYAHPLMANALTSNSTGELQND